MLEVLVAGDAHLLVDRDRVDVRGVRGERQVRAGAARLVDQLLDQEMRAVGAFGFEHAIERLEPFARFLRIDIGNAVHGVRNQKSEVRGQTNRARSPIRQHEAIVISSPSRRPRHYDSSPRLAIAVFCHLTPDS